jgi:SAM-dependent methyltransferase
MTLNSTVKPQICFICGQEKFSLFCEKMGGLYYKCKSCSLLVSSLAEESDERHDQDTGYEENAVSNINFRVGKEFSPRYQAACKKELRALEVYRKLNRLLDIGCGAGGFLLAARDMKWQGIGTEISSACIQAARRKELEVYMGNVTELDMEHESFDIIRMHNVIEHLKDPWGFLNMANKLLRHGGLLLLSTVNTDSFTASFQNENWKYINPRYHVHLFNTSNLSLLLKKIGFKVKRLQTKGVKSKPRKFLKIFLPDQFLKVPAKVLDKGHRIYLEIEKAGHLIP